MSNTNKGALFYNKKSADSKIPDSSGSITLSKEFINELIAESQDDAIQLSISSWLKVSAAGKSYQSLAISKMKVKPNA
jgi:hypothetical protein